MELRWRLLVPLPPHINCTFDSRRAGPSLAHGLNRFCDFDRRFGWPFDVGIVVDQTCHDAGLVADLMQMTLRFADCGRWNLPDDREYRRIHPIGRQQCSA